MRKIIAPFMNEHNPIYKKDPKAVVPPTPIPDGPAPDDSVEADSPEVEAPPVKKQANRRASKASKANIPSPEPETNEDEADFKKDTFQSAQEKIIEELLNLTDDE